MQEAQQQEIQNLSSALSADSVKARLERDTAVVALNRIQKRLDEVQAENMAARQELDLYQRIASNSARTGLAVDWESPWYRRAVVIEFAVVLA